MKTKINVKGTEISILNIESKDYICLTDIAKTRENSFPDQVIQNWLRNKHTVEFLGIWEKIHNPHFKPIEFEGIKISAGSNSFVLTPTRWIEKTNAKGIITYKGKYGGTYAHKHIALAFASWISPEFELYLVSEFDRLKEKESTKEELDWNLKRNLVKINYAIHTDAIKTHLIPKQINFNENIIYSTEADILNLALFGITSKDWKKQNPKLEGNLRDYANVTQLVCLSNLENINALFIKQNLSKEERLKELNKIAIEQMTILIKNTIQLKKLK